MIVVETSGPLFEGKIHIAKGLRLGVERATSRAAELARGRLRSFTRYSTAKYGHAAQSVRTRIETVGGTGGDQLIGHAYVGGQSAFVGRFLEFGTGRPGSKDPAAVLGRIGPKRQRRRGRPGALKLPGGRFVPFVFHPGTRAQRWASTTQAEINRLAPDIIRQALSESGA